MADLKAAAKMLRRNSKNQTDFLVNAPMHIVLAVQALEALAWQEKTGARVMHYPLTDQWTCETLNGKYYAADPLGALLAAMEGERNA